MQYLCAIMLIGYARVSTGEQTTAAQVAALKTSGCELIFRDNASGGRWDRPELHKLLSQLRKGDVLVVWTLDRLSRSLRDVLTIMERVQERHAGFRSLKEAVDTTTPAGRMMMQMVGAFAEFERAMLKERTKAGLDAARKEGPDRRPAAEAPPLSRWDIIEGFLIGRNVWRLLGLASARWDQSVPYVGTERIPGRVILRECSLVLCLQRVDPASQAVNVDKARL